MDREPLNRMFALDIGTRTVVGVLALGGTQRNRLEIIDMEVMEHRDRSMFDGQIHDIGRVTEVVKEVKRKLEQRNGCSLQHVSVAAAGRALITHRARISENVDGLGPADATFINSLELKAMQSSQQQIQRDYRENSLHYCVGYSVADYYLDGVPIKSLEGHRGFEMGVEVISTFLPRSVVESLYTVMERSGLEVINLTLEPIAAIGLAIPENLRMLNLAMVDIGAGTSDIAISRGGSIYAYSMVSMAGDEVTEGIAQHFLLDFKVAEELKKQLLSGRRSVACRDIMGNGLQISRQQLIESVRPVVEKISDGIAQSVLEYNQGPPKAIFCIGGGSLTPGIRECLASKLGLPEARVGIKGLEENDRFKVSISGFSGPEYITPAGIALAGYTMAGDHFMDVTVNGKALRLLNTRTITVSDALMSVGFSPRKLIPARGDGVRFFVNGEVMEVKGSPGSAAVIRLDGEEASLGTALENGSVVEVTEATIGERAKPTVAEIIQKQSCSITLEGKKITLPVRWTLNDGEAAADEVIKDGDRIEVTRIRNLGEFIKDCGLPGEGYLYSVNGQQVDFSYILKDGDGISLCEESPERVITVMVNGEGLKLPFREQPYIFVDLFNYMDFDVERAKGRIDLAINGKKAGYTDIISEGDSIEIYWNKA
ncbi:MAG: cell division protein FtsA [Bacillota bacterium]|nr:cell division protein FtsA [Bacillota bacterium]MDD3851525.1 cell division protein FtsA [Bacillota bacterium]MDD4708261.1 cell division protein FtsA [Bacillota bacterium]